MVIPAPKKQYPKYFSGINEMGLVYAEIDLISVDDLVLHRRGFLDENNIKKVRVNSLVDSGAYMLVINDQTKNQLDLPFIEKQIATLADDSTVEVEIVGPVEIRFENRRRRLTQWFFRAIRKFYSE